MIALPYNEYLQRFGAIRESMAAVAVEARKNGARIPWSYWHDRPLGADEYLSAPMLFDPVCRYDCDIPVDGVATFVLTSADRAKDLPHPPVYVAGYAAGCADPAAAAPALAARRHRRRRNSAGSNSFGSTRASPQLTSIYRRCTTASHCSSGYGWRFSGFARPGKLIASSRRAASTATAPAGYRRFRWRRLGNGRMHGIPQMLECYLQLARRAGDRQRANATIGLACHSSPHFGGAVVYSATQF